MYHGCDGIDHCAIAFVGFVASHCDTFELFDLTEEILDEMSPFVDLQIDVQRLKPPRMLRDDNFGPACSHLVDNPVCVERLVSQDGVEFHALDQRRNADRIKSIARHEFEPDKVAERIAQSKDLCGPAAFRLAYSLILSPPLAPCP